MLRTGELARIQTALGEWLPDTATVKRPNGAQASDGWAGGGLTTVATAVPCRVAPLVVRGVEIERVSGAAANGQWQITLQAGTAEIKPQDTITVAAVVYQVTWSDSSRSISGCVVCRCVRMDAP